MSYFQKLKYILPWVIVILWMMLIFHLSAQPAVHSDKLSRGVTKVVIETVKRVTSSVTDLSMDRLDHIVRKNAHFFIYFMLAIWVFFALRNSRIYGFKSFLFAMGICVLYAISDEIHQIFVAGRGPGVKDVLIDSSGSLVGLGLYRLCVFGLKKFKQHRHSSHLSKSF